MTEENKPPFGKDPLKSSAFTFAGLAMMLNIRLCYSAAPYALLRFKLPENLFSVFVRVMASSLELWCLPSMTFGNIMDFARKANDKQWKDWYYHYQSIFWSWANFVTFVILWISFIIGGDQGNVTAFYWVIAASGFVFGINMVMVYAMEYQYLAWYMVGENSFPMVTSLMHYVGTLFFGNRRKWNSDYIIVTIDIVISLAISLVAAVLWTIAYWEGKGDGFSAKDPKQRDCQKLTVTPTPDTGQATELTYSIGPNYGESHATNKGACGFKKLVDEYYAHMMSPSLMVLIGMGLVYTIYPGIAPGMIVPFYLVDKIEMILLIATAFPPVIIKMLAMLEELVKDYGLNPYIDKGNWGKHHKKQCKGSDDNTTRDPLYIEGGSKCDCPAAGTPKTYTGAKLKVETENTGSDNKLTKATLELTGGNSGGNPPTLTHEFPKPYTHTLGNGTVTVKLKLPETNIEITQSTGGTATATLTTTASKASVQVSGLKGGDGETLTLSGSLDGATLKGKDGQPIKTSTGNTTLNNGENITLTGNIGGFIIEATGQISITGSGSLTLTSTPNPTVKLSGGLTASSLSLNLQAVGSNNLTGDLQGTQYNEKELHDVHKSTNCCFYGKVWKWESNTKANPWHSPVILGPFQICLAATFIYSLHYRDSRISRAIVNQPKMSTALSIIFYMCHEIMLAVGFPGIASDDWVLLPMQLVGAFLMVLLAFYSIGYITEYKRHDPSQWPTEGMTTWNALCYWLKMASKITNKNFKQLFTTDLRRDSLIIIFKCVNWVNRKSKLTEYIL